MNAALVRMFEYNRWANLAILDACAALTEEQFGARAAGTFGSIRRTLVHLVGSQDVFLWRLASDNPQLERTAAELRGPWKNWDIVRRVNDRGSAGLIEAARATRDDDPDVRLPEYEGRVSLAPRSFVLLHALEHGIEHRAQICTTLTQIGAAPPDLDGWGYAAATGVVRPT
ncbi:MAG: DinB family protein [Hyphomicrobiales bacterium]